MRSTRIVLRVVGGLIVAAQLACAAGPQPIAYGTDACDFCRMAITDARFGGEVVSAKGKVRKFDSVECLASYALRSGDTTAGSRWVSDFRHPGTFVHAESARYVRAPGALSTPMGEALFAFAPDADVAAEARTLGGTVLAWRDVLAMAGRPDAAAPAGGADAAR